MLDVCNQKPYTYLTVFPWSLCRIIVPTGHLKRSPSCHAIKWKTELWLMNFKNILNILVRTLNLANPFSGGSDDSHNFQTSIVLCLMCFPSLVSILWCLLDWFYWYWFCVGSAVAVEHIFSGGRDTISLCRASLIPDTIQVLMLVKQHLQLAHITLQKDDLL